jgi:hypothetical protein
MGTVTGTGAGAGTGTKKNKQTKKEAMQNRIDKIAKWHCLVRVSMVSTNETKKERQQVRNAIVRMVGWHRHFSWFLVSSHRLVSF